MAVIVVCGGGKDVGKTALVCGLMAGLPEFGWTAVKVTSHSYGKAEAVWEETEAGPGTDTGRYLAAGARRALLVSAGDDELGAVVGRLLAECGPGTDWIFESNRVLGHVRADACLAVDAGPLVEQKASFRAVTAPIDAWVGVGDGPSTGEKVRFQLAALERVSAEMVAWVRGRVGLSTRGSTE